MIVWGLVLKKEWSYVIIFTGTKKIYQFDFLAVFSFYSLK